MAEPRLIKGGIAVDDRGDVSFVNDFDFAGVKRFYAIQNHRAGYVRAWHGHRKEGKYFLVLKGAMLLCGVEIDDWEKPSPGLKIHRHVLSEKSPALLYLPSGYANGLMSLTADAKLLVLSTSSLQDSLGDDVRFPARYWNPWDVEER